MHGRTLPSLRRSRRPRATRRSPLSAPPVDVARAVAGDPAAQRELVRAHGPRVYRMCRRLAADADDAYQAVWEKVFRSLSSFDPHGRASFASWLYTVTRRLLIDRHRRRGVRGQLVSADGLRLDDGQGPEEVTIRERERARLQAALAQLPEPQRAVVVGHHVAGHSLEELAAQEGVAVGTIKSRLHRGRARLAQILRTP